MSFYSIVFTIYITVQCRWCGFRWKHTGMDKFSNLSALVPQNFSNFALALYLVYDHVYIYDQICVYASLDSSVDIARFSMKGPLIRVRSWRDLSYGSRTHRENSLDGFRNTLNTRNSSKTSRWFLLIRSDEKEPFTLSKSYITVRRDKVHGYYAAEALKKALVLDGGCYKRFYISYHAVHCHHCCSAIRPDFFPDLGNHYLSQYTCEVEEANEGKVERNSWIIGKRLRRSTFHPIQ